MEKAVIKFNGGNLALLCSGCRTIIKTGVDFTEEEMEFALSSKHLDAMYCEQCKNQTMNNLKTSLYLDDVRTPTETLPGYSPWNIVRNYAEFEKWIIENGIPDLISFDHDLAKEHIDDYFRQFGKEGYQIPDYESYKEKTGLDCARFLVEYSQKMNVPLKQCVVHSHNPVGAKNIQSFINGFHRHMEKEENCYLHKFPFETKN